MITKRLLYLFIISMLVLITKANTQDLENLDEIPLIRTSGGVGFRAMYTETNDPTNQRDPWFWQFNANLNLNLLGVIDAPFSLVLNSQENQVNQPALPTQFGLSPTYKSISAHAGYRTMRFSDYSLGGLMFLGGGVEIKPKDHWLSGSAMYGRFSEALQPVEGLGLGQYERKGYGLKLNAGDNKNYVSLIGFRAKDLPGTLNTEMLSEDVAPQDNLIWSVLAGKQWGRLNLRTEYTSSALTRDTRESDLILNDFSYYNNLGGFFEANATTIVRSAFTFDANYAMDKYNLQFGYTRVAPDFASLGATSINDDLEEISGGIGWQMLNNTLNVNANVGVQRNNLDEKAAEGVRKLISAVNIFWMASERLNFNGTYSNFNSNTIRTATIDSDTLEFFQVTTNGSLTTTYSIGNAALPQTLILNANYQEATDSDNNDNDALNANLAYTITFPDPRLSGTISYNYNLTVSNMMEIATVGPSLSIVKGFKGGLTTSITGSSLTSNIDGEETSGLTNINFSARYSLKSKHSFGFTYLYIERASQMDGVASTNESRANFNYNFRF